MNTNLENFTDVLSDEICNSQPMSLTSSFESRSATNIMNDPNASVTERPKKGTGQRGQFRSTEEIDPKYRDVFSYAYFNLVQSSVIEDALYSDKSIVVCAPTGSGKTVVFEMAIVQLLMELEDKQCSEDFKIIYMAPVKALCTERLTEWYSKFTKLGLLCIEVTGDTDVDFTQLKPYKIIITTPEKWDMLTRRWRDHRGLVEIIKLFMIDEVHILNDELRGPVLEAVVSRMKTIESSAQSVHRIEQLQKELQGAVVSNKSAPRIRFVAVSATVSNPEDVTNWLGTSNRPAVFYKFGDECRPVKLKRVVEGYPCPEGTSIFKFDIILNYKLWPVIQKYHAGKPTLIFCNTRKSVALTAETLSRELTVTFNAEQKAKLTAIAASIKNKKLQALVMSGVGCHHAGLLYEERQKMEFAFRNRDLPILITTTTLAMGVNLPAHLVIVKNTLQYVNGAYQEYSISTVLQMVGRAGRPQFDTEATAVIMTRLADKPRYQALVGGCEPLQSYLHKRLAENLNSEAALGTVGDVAQCVQWLRSTFLYVRAARDPKKSIILYSAMRHRYMVDIPQVRTKRFACTFIIRTAKDWNSLPESMFPDRYLGLPQNSPQHLISKKIEELCVKAMNGLASSGLITMDDASCIESTEAGRLMSIFYLDLETMKNIMKIEGTESLERLLVLICESHELADMHLRMDERRCLNALNRNNAAATIRFPMKGKITTRQMKLNCVIQAVLGCLTIPDPSLNQEAMKIMRIADRVCKCLVTYVTRPDLISRQPQFYSAILNSIILAKCISAHLWENSQFVSKQLKGIGPTFSALLASAGKVNFMLLDESHPRDLERIMNKGAPAGNVLRKQISLLPKYQLTMKPVDEKTVTIQLVLLNQSYLSENMDNLTAGDTHKSYIIVGDSNNHLLLLAAFKDKDLISFFDGTITHEVRRIHGFEHKIFAHCISSSFVGIDVQSEYIFNDLDQYTSAKRFKDDIPTKKVDAKQTCITDTFKQRKRKNTDAIDKTQSKEKKKRDNAVIENFKYLKQSFEMASKNLKDNQLSKQAELLNKKTEICDMPSNIISNVSQENINLVNDQNNCNENVDSDELIDDEKIDNILNKIENEMCKNKISSVDTKRSSDNNNSYACEQGISAQNPRNPSNPSKFKADGLQNAPIQSCNTNSSGYKTIKEPRKRKTIAPKSNYTFIDLLERNCLSDDDDRTDSAHKDDGFSETIKSQIQKYLTKTQSKANVPDKNIKILLEMPEIEQPNERESHKLTLVNFDHKNPTKSPSQNLHPSYEIKEILGSTKTVHQNKIIPKTGKKDDGNSTYNEDTKVNDKKNINKFKENYIFDEIDASNYNANMQANRTLRQVISTNDNNKCYNVKETNLSSLDATIYSNEYWDSFGEMFTYEKKYNKALSTCNEINNIYRKECIEHHDLNTDNLEIDINVANASEVNNICHKTTKNTHLNKMDVNSITAATKALEINYNNVDNSSITDETGRTLSNGATLMIQDMGHINNIHCSETTCNKSIYNPSYIIPTSEFLSDREKFPNKSTADMNISNQKTEYTKRYTYSTMKVDVCTKQTSEYCVKVIKKIKMDLDLTAIVSRKHNSFQNCKSEYPSKREEEIRCIGKVKPSNSTFYNGYDGDLNESIITDSEIQNESEIPPILHQLSRTNKIGKPPDEIILPQENIQNNFVDTNKSDKFKPSVPTINKNSQSNNNADEIKTINDYKEQGNANIEYVIISPDIQQGKSDTELKNDNNIIKNILNKYSEIFGKNVPKNASPLSSGIKATVASNMSPRAKSKKPFKITDIHKLHATLPSTIISHKLDTENNVDAFTKNHKSNAVEKHDEEHNLKQYEQCVNINEIDENIPTYNSISAIDLEPIRLPVNEDLEPTADYKIDQSMFDPKTLLQCVVNDGGDEILPPPIEFCDGISFSSEIDKVENSTADYSQFFEEPQLSDFTENDMKYNDSIFEDSYSTSFTPSTEIETWNLPIDDWEPSNPLYISPPKSFTVMRKNNNFMHNSAMSRQVKLGKFKFSQKNKLKIRK